MNQITNQCQNQCVNQTADQWKEPHAKRKLCDNLLLLCLETYAIIVGGQLLGRILVSVVCIFLLAPFIPQIEENPVWQTAAPNASFIGVWIVGFLCIKISKNRSILLTQWRMPKGNRVPFLVLGLMIGFTLNGICILTAYLHGDITLVFDKFRPFSLLTILACVFIQSSAEEFLCRGFLYQRLRKSYKNPWIAILGSSLLFAAAHLMNPDVTFLSLVNITLAGLLFAMMVYYLDSIWCAYAAHTAWNFTQNILFGLPNSGIVLPYSVWKLDAGSARDSFAYHVGFGIEGTVTADIVLLIACLAIFVYGRKGGLFWRIRS